MVAAERADRLLRKAIREDEQTLWAWTCASCLAKGCCRVTLAAKFGLLFIYEPLNGRLPTRLSGQMDFLRRDVQGEEQALWAWKWTASLAKGFCLIAWYKNMYMCSEIVREGVAMSTHENLTYEVWNHFNPYGECLEAIFVEKKCPKAVYTLDKRLVTNGRRQGIAAEHIQVSVGYIAEKLCWNVQHFA